MRKPILRLLPVMLVAATLFLSGQSSNQGKVQDSESMPVLKVTTRLVVVDVVATDRKGLPVTDLGQNEFEVAENGKPQQVRTFSFQQPPAFPGDEQSAQVTPVAPLPKNVVNNVHRQKPGMPLAVLLLDGINTRMNNQHYAKQQLLEFLKKLPADQPVAVYLLGGRLRLIQDFTSDPTVLKGVVKNLKDFHSPLMDNANGGPVKFWFEGMPLPPAVKQRALEFQQETESDQADKRLAITLTALNQIARTLAGYPGRKNLIWVSETFPLILEPNKVPGGESAARARRNYSSPLAHTATLLSNAQVAVYPVDARALVGTDLYNVAALYDERGDKMASSGPQAGRAMSDTFNELSSAHGTMEALAEQTGGRAFYNRNDLDNAVREGITDGATYYTLGYYSTNKTLDGRYRKIRVRVTRPGVSLRYRLGYYALDPGDYTRESQQLRDAEFSSALSLESPASTALPFTAGVLPPSAQTANKTVVNFLADAHAISFSDTEGKKHAVIECAVRVFPAAGSASPLLTESDITSADLPAESYAQVMQRGMPCRVTLDLPAGEYMLRLGVRDNNTGAIGTASIQWNAASPEGRGSLAPAQNQK